MRESERDTHTESLGGTQRFRETSRGDTHIQMDKQTDEHTKEKQAATERIQEKQRIKYWETGKNKELRIQIESERRR